MSGWKSGSLSFFMHLQDLPSDALSIITKYLSAFDIANLWLSGNSELNAKLSQGGITDFHLVWDLPHPLRWPYLIYRFKKLEKLTIIVHDELPCSRINARFFHDIDVDFYSDSEPQDDYFVDYHGTLYEPKSSHKRKSYEITSLVSTNLGDVEIFDFPKIDQVGFDEACEMIRNDYLPKISSHQKKMSPKDWEAEMQRFVMDIWTASHNRHHHQKDFDPHSIVGKKIRAGIWADRDFPVDLDTIPSSVKSIYFDFYNAESCFIIREPSQNTMQVDTVPDYVKYCPKCAMEYKVTQTKKKDQSYGAELGYDNIAERLPALESLTLMGSSAIGAISNPGNFVKVLPKSITRLALPTNIHLGQTFIQDLVLLPNLRDLELRTTEEVHQASSDVWKTQFPPHLTRLHTNYHIPDFVSYLPLGLLDLGAFENYSLKLTDWPKLPPGLTKLSAPITKFGYKLLGNDKVMLAFQSLPSSIKELRVDHQFELDTVEAISCLPSSLELIEVGTYAPESHFISRMYPVTMFSLCSKNANLLPRNLKKLSIVEAEPEYSDDLTEGGVFKLLVDLPPKLETLVSSDEFMGASQWPKTITELCLQVKPEELYHVFYGFPLLKRLALPNYVFIDCSLIDRPLECPLEVLSISLKLDSFDCRFLPRSLLTFELLAEPYSSLLNPTGLPSLTYFSYTTSNVMIGKDWVMKLPESIRTLNLLAFENQEIDVDLEALTFLPKQLEHFSFQTSRDIYDIHIENLPRNLKTFELLALATHSKLDRFLQHLPPKLRRLTVPDSTLIKEWDVLELMTTRPNLEIIGLSALPFNLPLRERFLE